MFARLFPELGVADPLPTAEQFASAMLPRVILLEEDGEALGYAFWQVYGPTLHVVQVVVAPKARGRRAGQALLKEVRGHGRRAGCSRWYLNVKKDNTPALRLYERLGFTREMEGWALRTAWDEVAKLPDEPRAPAPRAPQPSDDPAIARRFDLDVERIATLRARPGQVLVVLGEPDHPLAFAGFAPAFPGVYPIRVARSELARAVFDALRPHARAPHLHVFVEGDRGLYELLCGVGARLEHAIFRMGAALPAPG